MKSILGFGIGETEETAETPPAPTVEQTPVRSLALVRFIGDGRAFTYYNDLFDLAVGDRDETCGFHPCGPDGYACSDRNCGRPP